MPLKIKSVALTAYQLGFALIIFFLIVDFKEIGTIWEDTHSLIGLVLELGILGTGTAYILYYYMIEKLGALKASSITYILPIVAFFIATTFIFLGVFLINKK